MKRILGLLLVMLVLWPAMGQAQVGWEISNFASDITIEQSGSVLIQEHIAVDFGSQEKHGIYRDVPVTYADGKGGQVYTRISDVSVLQDGAAATVEVTHNAANMRIRIGDANRTITGAHEYVISYRVVGVLQAFDGFDELYWNVTGTDWEAPINQVQATVHVPAEVVQAACYEGLPGSRTVCADQTQGNGQVQFTSNLLAAGEGLTVAVGYQPGVIPVVVVPAPPSPVDAFTDPSTAAVGLVVFFLGIGWLAYRWWRYGRDRYWQRAQLPGERSDRSGVGLSEKILPLFFRQSVSVEYDPPDDLRPAEIGVLMDERADTLDVSATIVDLAARGYMTIGEQAKKWLFGSTDYTFVRTGKGDGDLLKYERELLARLFADGTSVKLSDLKNTFYKDLAEVKKLLYEDVVEKHLFPASPQKVRQTSVAKAIGLGVVGGLCVVMGFVWLNNGQVAYVVDKLLVQVGAALGLIALLAFGFSRAMPRKTAYGRELYERSRGYQLFVSGTEKNRAKWMEDTGLFERVLPYAIMFGVTDKLAQAFKEMGIEPPAPTWFQGAAAFNAVQFASSMDSFSDSLSSAMASAPSSSGSGGGGFSGGGFGGGGGGSW